MVLHTTFSTLAIILLLLIPVPYDLEWIVDARKIPYQPFAFIARLVSTCRCLSWALGPVNRYYIMVYPKEFANYKIFWQNDTFQATSALIHGLRLAHPYTSAFMFRNTVNTPHTECNDCCYMFKLSMTSVPWCLRYRALAQGIRVLYRTKHEPLRTMQENARNEAFGARVRSGKYWFARLFFSSGSMQSQRLALFP